MKNYKILIIGGGIAGLSVMRALENKGFSPYLVEQSKTIRSDGTGILLGFNAVNVLANLGLYSEIEQAGLELSTMSAFDEKGKSIVACDLKYIKDKSGYPTYGIDRETLIKTLLKSVNADYIQTEKKVKQLTNTASQAEVLFEDGSIQSYDLVIGADGIHSSVRELIFGKIPLRDAKQGCWRFIIDTPHNLNVNGIFEYFGVGKRAGYMPMKNGQLYVYILLNADQYNEHALPSIEELLLRCEEFQGDWQLISQTLIKPISMRFDPIKDLSKICIMKDRVVLIGDASHAVTPNLGQGAAMGMEDAELLAHYLSTQDNIQKALQEFQQRRLKRVHSIQQKSYMIGKIAQSSSAMFCKIRNIFYKLIPSRLIAEDTLKTLSSR